MQLHLRQSLSLYVGGAIAALIFIYCLVRWKKNTHKIPPQPSGSWPFLGHLPLMGPHPHITLGKLADQYGPIFMLKLGVKRALVVSSGDMAKECLAINDKVFANRPHTLFVEHMAYNSAMFGFSPIGEYWRLMRKITSAELLSNNRIEKLKQVRISELRSAIKILLPPFHYTCSNDGTRVGEQASECSKYKGTDEVLHTRSEPIDMKQWFHHMILNTVVRLISSKSFKEIYQGEEYNRYAKAFVDFFELAGAIVPANLLPYLEWFDIGGYKRKIKMVAKEIDLVAQMWLEEHKTREGIE